jgi:hypothetical protein
VGKLECATEQITPTASTKQAALTALTASAASTALKPLSPDRPEVLIQAYLAAKTAWLARHPAVRSAEYRKARKWKTPRPKVLKEQVFDMLKERRNLLGSIIAKTTNWTTEKIIV